MAEIDLQFHGVTGEQWHFLLALAVAIGLTLLGWGLWLLWRGKLAQAAPCLAVGLVSVVSAGVLALASIAANAAWLSLLAVELVSAMIAIYLAAYPQLGPARLAALLAVRCLAALLLLAMLFRPAIGIWASRLTRLPTLQIIIDRSASMSTVDRPGAPSRYRQAIQSLKLQQDRLADGFAPAWNHFAGRPVVVSSLDELANVAAPPDGDDGTDVAAAIRGVLAGQVQSPAEAVLILSDGIHNSAASPIDAASQAGAPIYTVGVGSDDAGLSGTRNLAILSADCPQRAIRNNIATVRCRVAVAALAGVPLQLRLLDIDSGRAMDSADLWADKADETLQIDLKWTPTRRPDQPNSADVRRLRLSAGPADGERVLDDNTFELHALVTDSTIRVLYVEGALRPEFKFLRRYLASDHNVQLTSLVRVSDDRFLAQGDIDGKRLASLPAGDDFDLFDVIILGDLDSTLLTASQIARMRQFVNDGGGFVMLGGQNSFGPGGYGATEIGQFMPIIAGDRSQRQETTRLVPQLTAAGEAHPIFTGIAGYFPGPAGRQPDADKAELPELFGCVEVIRAKPAAEALAVHPASRNASGPLIVLAVQRFGAGRAAALTCDTTWRWYLPLRALGRDSPYERFWGQLVRWLADVSIGDRDGASCVVARLDKQYIRLGQSARLTAEVLDESGLAPDRPTVWAELRPAAGDAQRVELTRRPGGNLYQADLTPADQGPFTVTVAAKDASGQLLGSDKLPLVLAAASTETEQLARNDDLLRRIAEVSGGEFADIAMLPELVDGIVRRRLEVAGPPPRPGIYRLYHFPTFLAALVCLLTAEWVLRRHWRLS